MLRRFACWTALASIMVMIHAGPARADEVGLSLDGQQWSDELAGPLFDPAFRWVPGDSEVRSLWVRNEGPASASMLVAFRTGDADRLLSRADVRIDARVHDGVWTTLGDGSSEAVSDGVLATGERVRLDLRVSFDSASTNQAQVRKLPLTFVIRLSQAGPGGGNAGPDGPTGNLPDTGNDVELWLLWVAAGLLGTGFAVLATRRQEQHDD